MEKTYKITLPKGATISNVSTAEANGTLTVTVSLEKKYTPRDGDIVSGNGVIAIYAGTNKTGGIMTYAAFCDPRLQTTFCEIGWGYIADFRPATEAEKQRLFDALAKQGKRWNAGKKCIEDLPRWRADDSGTYYYVTTIFSIEETKDLRLSSDDMFYESGNYFRTREAAEKVAEQIRDIFKNSKAE